MHRSRYERLPHGKTATVIAMSWAPDLYGRLIPNFPPRHLCKHLHGICGIRLPKAYLLGSMDSSKDTNQRRANFIERIEAAAQQHG